MYAKIIGLGAVTRGTSQKTGNPYHGQKIHLSYARAGIAGQAVKEQYISFLEMDKPPVFKLGSEVFLDFDDKGYLLSCEVITPEK